MIAVVSIAYKPESILAESDDHYTRVALTEANLVSGHGIQGDRKGGHPNRQLNIMSAETLDELRAEGFSTAPGQMGEQIVIRGLNVTTLAAGDRLQIGAEARVEVLSHRSGCDRFKRIQGKSPELAAGRLGVIAAVVAGGPIRVGDPVQVV